MKWVHRVVFVISGAFSFISLMTAVGGFMVLVLVQLSTSGQTEQFRQVGRAISDLGLLGVPAFGWLYVRSLKAHRIR